MSKIQSQKVQQLLTNLGRVPFKKGGVIQRQKGHGCQHSGVVRVGSFPCLEIWGFSWGPLNVGLHKSIVGHFSASKCTSHLICVVTYILVLILLERLFTCCVHVKLLSIVCPRKIITVMCNLRLEIVWKRFLPTTFCFDEQDKNTTQVSKSEVWGYNLW